MYKLSIIIIGFLILTVVPEVNASAKPVGKERKIKIEKLSNFLEKQKSPLFLYAPTLVDTALQYDLDYRLVTAISGVESSFGKAIPQGSYNAYGWANGAYYFKNWEDGIRIVSSTLGTTYKQKWGADNPYKIGRYYAASPTWATRVVYFMNQIEKSTPTVSQITLSL